MFTYNIHKEISWLIKKYWSRLFQSWAYECLQKRIDVFFNAFFTNDAGGLKYVREYT